MASTNKKKTVLSAEQQQREEAARAKVQEQLRANRERKAAQKAKTAQKKAEAEREALFVSPLVDRLLWALSAVIIVAAIGGNYYYTQYVVIDEGTLARLGRVLAVIGAIVVGLALLVFTNRGHALLHFASRSYDELRKVFWPTRQEAVQTTLIVFVAVCVVSLFLYLCDVIFLQLVKWVTL